MGAVFANPSLSWVVLIYSFFGIVVYKGVIHPCVEMLYTCLPHRIRFKVKSLTEVPLMLLISTGAQGMEPDLPGDFLLGGSVAAVIIALIATERIAYRYMDHSKDR